MKLKIKAAIILNPNESDILELILTKNTGAISSKDSERADAFKKEFLKNRAILRDALQHSDK